MTKSVLYLHKEQVFGGSPVYNSFTGRAETCYCAPFTISEHDDSLLRKDIELRIDYAISNKGYTLASVHWAPMQVLYWKNDNV